MGKNSIIAQMTKFWILPWLAILRGRVEAVEIIGVVVARHTCACNRVLTACPNVQVEGVNEDHKASIIIIRGLELRVTSRAMMDADPVADPPHIHVRQGRRSRTAPPIGFDQHHDRLHVHRRLGAGLRGKYGIAAT